MRAVITSVVLVAALAMTMPPVAHAARTQHMVLYVAPTFATVADPFRPPAHIGAPGNRGLEYGNAQGEIIAAAANGFVTFAGSVAGRNVITLEHLDGVRTTYSGLTEIWVTENTNVSGASSIGVAAEGFHFGARIRDHYLDPQILLDASQPSARPRLVPPPDD